VPSQILLPTPISLMRSNLKNQDAFAFFVIKSKSEMRSIEYVHEHKINPQNRYHRNVAIH
jgi:hypothetical protein